MSEHKHETSCQHLLATIGEYVDGELSEQLCQELERHIAGCENCRVVVDTLNKTVYLYHVTAQESEVPQDVRGRLFQTLKLDEFVKKTP
jgi:anti-sigma factor (TIGR02949 family)